MRIAILIPGQARFFKHNAIIDLKNKYDADVFIHTWNEVPYYKSVYSKVEFSVSETDVKEYITKYNPKKYLIEENITDEFIDTRLIKREIKERTSNVITKYNMYRYFYSLNKCWELIGEQRDEYDFLIIVRSDMDIILLPGLDTLDNNTIYAPIHNRDNRNGDNNHCYTDLFLFVIPPKYMYTYISIIDNMDRLYDMGYHYNYDEMFYAWLKESKLYENTKQLKIGKEIFFTLRRDDIGLKPKHYLN